MTRATKAPRCVDCGQRTIDPRTLEPRCTPCAQIRATSRILTRLGKENTR